MCPMRTDQLALHRLPRLLRGHVDRITDRADHEARAAGLAVEVLRGGRRRYRDPRFDQRAVGQHFGKRGQADIELWSAPTLVATAEWSR